ncbi:MAG: hypothetical protein ACLP9L_14660, partial [Thermoguttaceae bacterium]
MAQGNVPRFRNPHYIDVVIWAAGSHFSINVNSRTPQIAEIAKTFFDNIDRRWCLAKLPASAAGHGMRMQNCTDAARFNVLGRVEHGDEREETAKEQQIQSEGQRLWPQFKWVLQPGFDSVSHHDAAFVDRACTEVEAAGKGIDALLASLIIGTWTAFEVLATHLWEAALNYHPSDLCLLKGNRNRIAKAINSPLTQS